MWEGKHWFKHVSVCRCMSVFLDDLHSSFSQGVYALKISGTFTVFHCITKVNTMEIVIPIYKLKQISDPFHLFPLILSHIASIFSCEFQNVEFSLSRMSVIKVLYTVHQTTQPVLSSCP